MTALHTLGLLIAAYALVAGAIALLFIAIASAWRWRMVQLAPLAGRARKPG
ncbi:MAG: hypothetical protein H6701_05515, partial [Myxococcales bacterium]|nr:hypothetical protein [Myxococcales bacterium]